MTFLQRIFSIDLRTLAFFRLGLAAIILADLLVRCSDLTAHYTDLGTFPRTAAIDYFGNIWSFSLYFLNGSLWFQILLFSIMALFAFALLFGYRTRIATIALFVLIISLQNRHPILLNGGDNLLGVLLFWAIFLPLGARYSVDSALDNGKRPADNHHFSIATIAILIQSMSLYLFTAILKTGDVWWPNGTAVHYALQLDQFAKPFGIWLREQPFEVLQFLAYAVLALEFIAPILMFTPIFRTPIRLGILAALVSMHLGFHFGLRIGWFSFISMVSISNFIPGSVWDYFAQRFNTPARRGLQIFYDGDCGFCRKTALLLKTFLLIPSNVPIKPAQEDAAANALLDQHFTWVLRDVNGNDFIKWQALIVLVKHSPLFWHIAYLMSLRIFDRLGLAFYHWVGRNRGVFGELTGKFLPYRPIKLHNHWLTNTLVGFLTLYVLCWNIASVPGVPYGFSNDPLVRMPAYLFRLDQKWSMFAPQPFRDDGWFVIRGELNDGTVVDVRHETIGEPDIGKPALASADYTSFRWRKYMRRLWEKRYSKYRLQYGQYLCRNWNSQAIPSDKKLNTFTIDFYREDTPPPGQPNPTAQKIQLWEHFCFKIPKT